MGHHRARYPGVHGSRLRQFRAPASMRPLSDERPKESNKQALFDRK